MSSSNQACPKCRTRLVKDIAPHLHICKSCHIAFNSKYRPLDYNDAYFLDEYRTQYGKTYAADFDSIYSMASRRLSTILPLLNSENTLTKTSLLDIGSALGFFLKRARDLGISDLQGIEISHYGSAYAQKHFDIPIKEGSFHDTKISRTFSIITAWFFIEHSPDPFNVIRQIYDMLEHKGVFAFSMPSYFGPLFHFMKKQWIETHPPDHRIDISPRSAKKILKETGFKKVVVKPGGYHPERVLNPRNPLNILFLPLYRIFTKLTAYSDTIEVYAVK